MKIEMNPFARRTAAALAFTVLAACGTAGPQGPSPETMADDAAATITAADMGMRIGALAHDSMRGRDTPSPELEKAAAWIASEFRRMGLEPAGDGGSFLHRWDYEQTRFDADATVVRVTSDGATAPEFERDYFLIRGQQPSTEAAGLYAGTAGEVQQLPAEARGRFVFFDTRSVALDAGFQQELGAAIQPAMFGGAAGVFVILNPEFPGAMIGQISAGLAGTQAPVPVVGITDEAARQLMASAGADLDALRSAGQPASLGDATFEVATAVMQETHTPANVVAMRRGSDPELRDTYVVMTAHYDHVGVGAADETGDSIFNGADDDASGTSAIIEMAEAFASMPQAPARSVIFLLVSGEEKGLLGSMAWIENPPVPVDSIVANVNLDMVGRNAPDTVIGIGQEYSTLEDVVQGITDRHPSIGLNVILDPVPEEQYFFRSDQLGFIQKGIPAVFLTTGDHEDYHSQSDEPHTIDNDKAARVARLGFYIAHAIATSVTAPEWTDEGWQRVQAMLRQMGM